MLYSKFKSFFLLLLLPAAIELLSANKSLAQNKVVKFSSLTIEDGLSQSDVKSIIKDRLGFMWFSTDDGLSRYDGYNFTAYKHNAKDPHSIPANDVTDLFEDKQGNLWIGSGGGLSLYNYNTNNFTTFRANKDDESTLSDPDVAYIFQDSKNRIWVCSYSGLNLFDVKTKKVKRFLYTKNRDDIYSHHITSMTEDNDGIFWLGTEGGLVQFNPATGATTTYVHTGKNSLSNNLVNTVFKNPDGNLYIGTRGGGLDLFDIKAKTFINFSHQPNNPASLVNNNVFAITPGKFKKLWIATENGLDLFDEVKHTFTKYTSEDKSIAENNSINCIYNDAGILWLGTYDSGVVYYDTNLSMFDYYHENTSDARSLSNNIVTSFTETATGYLVGTDGGGLNSFDAAKQDFTHYASVPGIKTPLSGKHILDLLTDSQRNLWVGYYTDGLDLIDGKTKSLIHFAAGNKPGEISSPNVFALTEDKAGNVWVGLDDGGINIISDKKVIKRYRHSALDTLHSLSNDDIRSIYRDKDNRMWIGTFGGLNLYNPASDGFTCFKPTRDGLSSNIISTIFEDHKGTLWIGTLGGGLYQFDRNKKTFSAYTFPSGSVYSIINYINEDDIGFLWVTTNKGLISFRPGTNDFRKYSTANNLQGYEFFSGAGLKASNGELLFGGHNGFNIVDPYQLATNKNMHNVVFTDFQLFNKKVPFGENSVLKKPITLTKEIRLDYEQSVFTIEYSALNFTLPEMTSYAYTLENFEKGWNYVGSQRKATYTNLNPGEYIFKVKAANNDGVWNKNIAFIKIIIIPPFYMTWWFRTVCIALISLLIFGFYRYRLYAIRKQKKVLE